MCERAGLLVGWDDGTHRALVARADCDSWDCPECAERMSSRWVLRAEIGARALLADGFSVDFVTITSHEKLTSFEATEAVWRSAWGALYKALRRRQPQLQFFTVPEKHKDGRMHVHSLWNANVTRKWLKDNARRRGLGYQAAVEHVRDPQAAVRYVTKYVGKSLGKDVPPHFRRVRVSRGWADIPAPVTENSDLRWEYIGSNGALEIVYRECRAKHITLIDCRTGEIFDDVDLGTTVYA